MIYTSYFSNYRNFPKNSIVVSIAQFPPKNWKGIELKSLAPASELLMQYKTKNIDEFTFRAIYLNQLSHDLNLKARIVAVLKHLEQQYENVILCCYETEKDFCHRHLVAEWLDMNIKELNNNE